MVANSHIKFKYSVYPYNDIASLLTEIFDRVYKCSILLNIVLRLKEITVDPANNCKRILNDFV